MCRYANVQMCRFFDCCNSVDETLKLFAGYRRFIKKFNIK